jgi:hypothetical protein
MKIEKAKRDVKQQVGERFTDAWFNDLVISTGMIPVNQLGDALREAAK